MYVVSSMEWPFKYIDTYIKRALRKMSKDVQFFDIKKQRDVRLFDKAVKQFRPRYVFTIMGATFTKEHIYCVKERGGVTGCWFVDDPYAIDHSLKRALNFDYVFTVDSACAPYYRAVGCKRVYHVPLGADPEIFKPQRIIQKYVSDICIIGSAFENRLEIVDEITPYLLGKRVKIIGQWWDRLRNYNRLKPFITNMILNPAEAARYYCGARINLNIHRPPDCKSIKRNTIGAPAYTPNNRTFEISAAGGFQICDMRRDLPGIYDTAREIPVFNSIPDLLEKLDRFLADDSGRKEMAARARHRTLNRYTYVHRLKQMFNVVKG